MTASHAPNRELKKCRVARYGDRGYMGRARRLLRLVARSARRSPHRDATVHDQRADFSRSDVPYQTRGLMVDSSRDTLFLLPSHLL